ncbi:small multi-drug export protein [Candidatus Uhrbacteria bacterium]|nr:small multi-drug export protein [Candidatus Uhrbacteria bacterium]
MLDALLTLLKGLPPEIATAVLAMIPITEQQASIPVALQVFGLPLWLAVTASFLGNAVPMLLILRFLPPVLEWAERRSPWIHRHFFTFFHKRRERFQFSYDKYGAIALCLFIMIPTPFTGVWTASVLAVLFHIRPRYAAPAILLGMAIAGAIVVGVFYGVVGFAG